MEQENKKRERDHQEYEEQDDHQMMNNNANKNKKQELVYFDHHDNEFFTTKTDYSSSSFGYPLGVFDFPWLKENRVSESDDDDWNKFDYYDEFSYNSSNLLIDAFSALPPDDGGLEFPAEVLCETSTTTSNTTHDGYSAGEKVLLEEKSWLANADDLDGVDCIWSCVLSQPLISAVGGTGCGGSRQKDYRVVG